MEKSLDENREEYLRFVKQNAMKSREKEYFNHLLVYGGGGGR